MSYRTIHLPVLAGGGASATDMDELHARNQDSPDVSGPSAAGLTPFRVALVSLPFGPDAATPSPQLGLLRAIAEEAGFATDTYHLYLDLAARIGPEVYSNLCKYRGQVTSEWLFTVAAFGAQAQDSDEEYFRAFPGAVEWFKERGKDASYLSSLRHAILPQYIA